MLDEAVGSLEPYFSWAPPWVFSLVLIALALGAALVAYGGVVRVVRLRLSAPDSFWRPLFVRTRGPVRLAFCLGALSWAVSAAPLPPEIESPAQHGLLIAFILLCGWAAMTALDIGAELYLGRYDVGAADNLNARKHLTQVKILRRAAATLVVLLTLAAGLMTIPGVKQLGVSLLAAGGAASIIVGMALQPVLSNLFAGVQIALTQPIRLDDAVVVEGEWGRIEEISSTYVVIRLWDLRRLIVPLKYFLEKPFQNWTRESSDIVGTVMLQVDYSLPVDTIRAKLGEILETSPLWDRKTSAVQVTDFKERTMEIRILASARGAGEAFDLRCVIREEMIAWLRDEHPEALPRDRIEVGGGDASPLVRSAARPSPGRKRVEKEDGDA